MNVGNVDEQHYTSDQIGALTKLTNAK
jgi:hypothetical protein